MDDAGELVPLAWHRAGQMLGDAKEAQGARTDLDGDFSPHGEKLDRNARHRYRELAGIDPGELRAYLDGAREKYLADEARIAVQRLLPSGMAGRMPV